MTAPDIFLSYNREDAATARVYADAFAEAGLEVWWDAALRSGESYDEVTEAALREARAVVVLWSPRSVVSRWVRAEATIADRNKTFMPVMIEACERPIMFELTQTAELTHWKGDPQDSAWQALLSHTRQMVEARAPARPAPPESAAAAIGAPVAQRDKPAIIILPFANMSGDAEQEFFTDGVSEDIITDLAKVSALSVVSRNTAFAFKGKTIVAARIAQDLKVDFLLEGSVRKSGNRVRITAQLLDARTDEQIWAERFDRDLDDIFAIQDEIAKAIVAALKLKLAPDEKRALDRRTTTNAEAYELYQMARQFSRTGSERIGPAIIRICQKVVELDPGFASAWALMSMAESEMSQRGVEGHSHESAKRHAERAVAADFNCAVAHAALAEAIIRGSISWAAFDSGLAAALRLDPDCFEAHLVGGDGWIMRRDFPNAIRCYERALELDPDSVRAAGMVVQAYRAIDDGENVTAAARRAISLCEKMLVREPDHGTALGHLVASLAGLGDAERAREWSRRAMLLDPDNSRLQYNLACAMAQLNDVTVAVELIDGLVDRMNSTWVLWIEEDNDLDPIRDDPRFVATMKRARERFEREAVG